MKDKIIELNNAIATLRSECNEHLHCQECPLWSIAFERCSLETEQPYEWSLIDDDDDEI